MRSVLLLLITLLMAACAGKPTGSLYEQLGGADGVSAIVDNFLYNVADDPVIRPLFDKTDLERFHEKLSEQICEVADGPCKYTGDDMTEVHAGMAMNNRHFDAVVTALDRAMIDAGVAFSARNALLARLAAMYEPVMREAVDPR